jgi:hypothetical protein
LLQCAAGSVLPEGRALLLVRGRGRRPPGRCAHDTRGAATRQHALAYIIQSPSHAPSSGERGLTASTQPHPNRCDEKVERWGVPGVRPVAQGCVLVRTSPPHAPDARAWRRREPRPSHCTPPTPPTPPDCGEWPRHTATAGTRWRAPLPITRWTSKAKRSGRGRWWQGSRGRLKLSRSHSAWS